MVSAVLREMIYMLQKLSVASTDCQLTHISEGPSYPKQNGTRGKNTIFWLTFYGLFHGGVRFVDTQVLNSGFSLAVEELLEVTCVFGKVCLML